MGKIPRLACRSFSEGGKKSFTIAYKTIALPLTKFIVRKAGGNQEAVDEILSRTLLAAWKSWGRFEYRSSFFTWVCKIAINKTSDYYREQVNRNSKLVAPFLADLANYDSRELTPEEWYELNELCNSVKKCVKILPKSKQDLIYLRYWKGLAVKQIAEITGESERSIEGKLYRTKQKLKYIVKSKNPELSVVYEKQS